MDDEPATVSPDALQVLAWAFLGGIVVMTIVAVPIASAVVPVLDSETALLANVTFLLVAVSHLVIGRAVVLPSNAKGGAPTSSIAVLGYALAESAVIYGLVLVVLSGDVWRIVPFTVIAVVGWLLTRSFVQQLGAESEAEEFPTL